MCLIPLDMFKTIYMVKGAFIDSSGRDYYKIGTAADIQVIVVHIHLLKRQRQKHPLLSFDKDMQR